MELVNEIFNVTQELIEALEQVDDNDPSKRDTLIQVINELLEKRSDLLNKLAPPYSQEAMIKGKEIIALNQKVEKKMNLLFDHVKQDLKSLKARKDRNLSYINPYGAIKTVDGMYLDSKR